MGNRKKRRPHKPGTNPLTPSEEVRARAQQKKTIGYGYFVRDINGRAALRLLGRKSQSKRTQRTYSSIQFRSSSLPIMGSGRLQRDVATGELSVQIISGKGIGTSVMVGSGIGKRIRVLTHKVACEPPQETRPKD